jgi:multidrug efflux pump
MLPDDINLWYVRNSSGTMVPFSAFAISIMSIAVPVLMPGAASPTISTAE